MADFKRAARYVADWFKLTATPWPKWRNLATSYDLFTCLVASSAEVLKRFSTVKWSNWQRWLISQISKVSSGRNGKCVQHCKIDAWRARRNDRWWKAIKEGRKWTREGDSGAGINEGKSHFQVVRLSGPRVTGEMSIQYNFPPPTSRRHLRAGPTGSNRRRRPPPFRTALPRDPGNL